MAQDYRLLTYDEVLQYLEVNNKDFSDVDSQLPGNYAEVYNLENGEIIIMPNDYMSVTKIKSILFYNEEALKKCIQSDYYPVEDVRKNEFEQQQEAVKNIHQRSEYFKEYLRNRFPKSDTSLSTYYIEVMKLYNKDKEVSMDIIALVGLIGEEVRSKIDGGVWLLVKKYGIYNPYFRPYVIDSKERVYDIHMDLISSFTSYNKDFSMTMKLLLFNDLNYTTDYFKREKLPFYLLNE